MSVVEPYLQWAIFSCVHLAKKYSFGCWPDVWDVGGHCAATATFGTLLTEAVTGFTAFPRRGAARRRWADGSLSPRSQSLHSYFCVATPQGMETVDLRTVLLQIPAEEAPRLMGGPSQIPAFVWGEIPPWLVIEPHAGGTLHLSEAAVVLRRGSMFGWTMQVAAELLRAGEVDKAARTIAERFHWLQRQEQ